MACLREPCPPVNGCKKEEINTSQPETGHSRRCFARLVALFTLLPPCLSLSILPFLLYFLLWFYKRNWHPDPYKMVFWGTLVRHLLGLLAFRIKSYSSPQHLVSRFIGLSCGRQSELGLSNTTLIKLLRPFIICESHRFSPSINLRRFSNAHITFYLHKQHYFPDVWATKI